MEERARTGGLHLFGPSYDLPSAICSRQNRFLWGPPKEQMENLIWLQWDRESIEERCRTVEQVAEHRRSGLPGAGGTPRFCYTIPRQPWTAVDLI